ncbi:MAG TPA: hypothetical protein VNT55_03460 [Baekduia sp.]|nr:hypothetical protein [Baekduia sp.]
MSVSDRRIVMLSESAHRILADPISVGMKVMPNRLYRPTGFDPGRELRNNDVNRAGHELGDWGTVMSGPWTVPADRTTDDPGRQWEASARSAVKQMCSEAHVQGALAGLVLRCAWPALERAPSSSERDELLAARSALAREACRIGCDIITLYGGPPTRRSGDIAAAPGDLAEDVWRETIERVAADVRDECAVAVEMHPATELTLMELVDGAVDLWVLPFDDHDPGRAREARAHTTKPLVGVGRFGGADRMVAAVQSGAVDVIGPLDVGPVIR